MTNIPQQSNKTFFPHDLKPFKRVFFIKVWNTYCRGSKKVNFGPNWTKFEPNLDLNDQYHFCSPRMAKEASFPHVLKPWVIVFHKLLKFFTKEGQKMSILAKIGPNLALKNQFHFHSIREPNIVNFQHGEVHNNDLS